MDFPDVTHRAGRYAAFREQVLGLARHVGLDPGQAAARWEALFRREPGEGEKERLLLAGRRQEGGSGPGVAFRFPHRFSSLPLPDQSQDLACSFAVLEHVRSPEQCLAELRRVLRPGGWAAQTIVTRDHRSFSRIPGYTPISYRRHSEAEWADVNRDKFHQNRLAPWQWRDLFAAAGFEVLLFRVHSRHEPDAAELAALNPDFQGWSADERSQVDCTLVARR